MKNEREEIIEFSKRLKVAMAKADVTQTELAQKTGLSNTSINKYCLAKIKPKYENVNLIAKALHVSTEWLLNGSEDSPPEDLQPGLFRVEKKKFPLLGEIACGEPMFADEHIETYIEADSDIKADYCIRCKGDSMINAHIQDGDIVFIRKQPMVENGEIAAVLIGDDATLKRFYYDRLRSDVTLVAENNRIGPIVKTGAEIDTVKVLGKAVAFYHNLE